MKLLVFVFFTSFAFAYAYAQEVPSVQGLFNAIKGQKPSVVNQRCVDCLEQKTIPVYGQCQKANILNCNGPDCASRFCQKLSQLEDRGTQLVFSDCQKTKLEECLKSGQNIADCNKLNCNFYSKTPSKFYNIAHCPNPEEVKNCEKHGGGSGCIKNKCHFYSLSEYKNLQKSRPLLVSGNIANVPYFSQFDNVHKPRSTCQNTAIAMVVAYVKPNLSIKPDTITLKFGNDLGKSPEGAAEILRHYGVKSVSSREASYDTFLRQIELGRPVLVNGWFTKNGHVVVVTGYDKIRDEFIVNDSAGKWSEQAYGGYPVAASGKQVRYKASAFKNAIMPDGKIWMAVPVLEGQVEEF